MRHGCLGITFSSVVTLLVTLISRRKETTIPRSAGQNVSVQVLLSVAAAQQPSGAPETQKASVRQGAEDPAAESRG